MLLVGVMEIAVHPDGFGVATLGPGAKGEILLVAFDSSTVAVRVEGENVELIDKTTILTS